MSVASRNWTKAVELEVFRAIKQAPRPKGSGRGRKGDGVKFRDLFPGRKPGEGGFNLYGKNENNGATTD